MQTCSILKQQLFFNAWEFCHLHIHTFKDDLIILLNNLQLCAVNPNDFIYNKQQVKWLIESRRELSLHISASMLPPSSFTVCMCIYYVTIYLHSESSNSSWVECWVPLVLLVNQSIMGNETVGLSRFTPFQMGWVCTCQSAQHVGPLLILITLQPYQLQWDSFNSPVVVAVGGAIFCGLASKVWAKAHWLRTEPLEFWARTLYWK